MIRPQLSGVRIYVATAGVDGRKSFDTLCEVVRVALGRDPLSGDMFVFRNRQANRVKVLFFDRNGLVTCMGTPGCRRSPSLRVAQ